MGGRRPQRTSRRSAERAARGLVRDRERLFRLEAGGSRERPIDVTSAVLDELRAGSTPCPQCEGSLRLEEHVAESALLRRLAMRCVTCGVARDLFFRISPGPS